MIFYLCKKCCELNSVRFSGIAVNMIGRKSCHLCGNNSDTELEVISEAKLEQLLVSESKEY